jgi:chloramphenicol 3-O phosphotransferase
MLGEPRVIVLNGGSSSGKSSLARALQDVLAELWLRLGVDDLIDAAPPWLFFVSGPAAQRRWMAALSGVDTHWIGVRCAPEIAATREATRGDRPAGMAANQANAVHQGIHYDLVVDTSSTPAAELAEQLRVALSNGER